MISIIYYKEMLTSTLETLIKYEKVNYIIVDILKLCN